MNVLLILTIPFLISLIQSTHIPLPSFITIYLYLRIRCLLSSYILFLLYLIQYFNVLYFHPILAHHVLIINHCHLWAIFILQIVFNTWLLQRLRSTLFFLKVVNTFSIFPSITLFLEIKKFLTVNILLLDYTCW